MFVRQGLLLIGTGVAGGLIAAFAAIRLMSSLLFGVSPNDPATFIGVAVLFFCVLLPVGGVHVHDFPMVPVEIEEGAHLHEAIVLRRLCLAPACLQGGVSDARHVVLAVHADADERLEGAAGLDGAVPTAI